MKLLIALTLAFLVQATALAQTKEYALISIKEHVSGNPTMTVVLPTGQSIEMEVIRNNQDKELILKLNQLAADGWSMAGTTSYVAGEGLVAAKYRHLYLERPKK
jgi:glutamine amidotransferase PdxT